MESGEEKRRQIKGKRFSGIERRRISNLETREETSRRGEQRKDESAIESEIKRLGRSGREGAKERRSKSSVPQS